MTSPPVINHWLAYPSTTRAYRLGVKAGLQAADGQEHKPNPYRRADCLEAWSAGYNAGFMKLKAMG